MICSSTHQGYIKGSNEDRFYHKQYNKNTYLMAIADGVDGEPAGELAAQIAIDSLEDFHPDFQTIPDNLSELILSANNKIQNKISEDKDLNGMGTTMTAVAQSNGFAYWVHIGDSRFYLFRDNKLAQITEDHTPTGLLLADGEITKEEARIHPLRNILFECLGCDNIEIDKGGFKVMNKDLVLLSTDGIHDELFGEAITSILCLKTALQEKLDTLVNAALEAGGRDNITLVAAQM